MSGQPSPSMSTTAGDDMMISPGTFLGNPGWRAPSWRTTHSSPPYGQQGLPTSMSAPTTTSSHPSLSMSASAGVDHVVSMRKTGKPGMSDPSMR